MHHKTQTDYIYAQVGGLMRQKDVNDCIICAICSYDKSEKFIVGNNMTRLITKSTFS